jgi:hypothetical protein
MENEFVVRSPEARAEPGSCSFNDSSRDVDRRGSWSRRAGLCWIWNIGDERLAEEGVHEHADRKNRRKAIYSRTEDQISFNRKTGMRSEHIAGEYILEVRVSGENRTFEVPVDGNTYEAVRTGGSFHLHASKKRTGKVRECGGAEFERRRRTFDLDSILYVAHQWDPVPEASNSLRTSIFVSPLPNSAVV